MLQKVKRKVYVFVSLNRIIITSLADITDQWTRLNVSGNVNQVMKFRKVDDSTTTFAVSFAKASFLFRDALCKSFIPLDV